MGEIYLWNEKIWVPDNDQKQNCTYEFDVTEDLELRLKVDVSFSILIFFQKLANILVYKLDGLTQSRLKCPLATL